MTPEQENQLRDLYSLVPGLGCGDCRGDCCVSPTMTAPEFAHFLRGVRQEYGEGFLEVLRRIPAEHPIHLGNNYCRLQDPSTGRCTNYEHRALACRLHGHDALRAWATPDMEFCEKKPAGYQSLRSEEVELQLRALHALNAEFNLRYEGPYYLFSLSLDAWLDFALNPRYSENRPALAPLRAFFDIEFANFTFPRLPTYTTLGGKLDCIDRLQKAIAAEDAHAVLELLRSLQTDFPSCGSYFLAEAEVMESQLTGIG